MGSDWTEKFLKSETVVIHVHNIGTGEMIVIFFTWIIFLLSLFFFGLKYFHDNIYFYLVALFGNLWFFYYFLRDKSIYISEQGLSGPFFELSDLIINPIKTRYFVPFDNVLKIKLKYQKEADGYRSKFYIDDTYYIIVFENSEVKKLHNIMRRIQPDIPIEISE